MKLYYAHFFFFQLCNNSLYALPMATVTHRIVIHNETEHIITLHDADQLTSHDIRESLFLSLGSSTTALDTEHICARRIAVICDGQQKLFEAHIEALRSIEIREAEGGIPDVYVNCFPTN